MPNFSSQFDMNNHIPDIAAIEADVADIADISHARLKLDDLLNEIIDKNEDCLGSADEEGRRARASVSSVSSSGTAIAKRPYTVGKANRKKKKKELVMDDSGEPQRASYIIKLFDREVDLARFEADTSLYSMAREWMKNKPHETPLITQKHHVLPDDTTESENHCRDGEDNDELIHDLPKPNKFEEACYPRPLPPALKTALIENIINTESNIEELRKDNMLRWRKVRNRWKEHSFRQQRRYGESLIILKKLFSTQNSS